MNTFPNWGSVKLPIEYGFRLAYTLCNHYKKYSQWVWMVSLISRCFIDWCSRLDKWILIFKMKLMFLLWSMNLNVYNAVGSKVLQSIYVSHQNCIIRLRTDPQFNGFSIGIRLASQIKPRHAEQSVSVFFLTNSFWVVETKC